MTKNRAIQQLEIWRDCMRADLAEPDVIETYNMAIQALQEPSAEPREVLYYGDGYADGEMVYDMAECPNCGRKFEDGDETWNCNFCPECGQALDWGLDNAEED